MAAYAIIMSPLFFLSSTLIDRIYLFFYPMLAFFVNQLIKSFKYPSNKIAIKGLFVIISFIFLYVWLNFADNKNAWVPYNMIF